MQCCTYCISIRARSNGTNHIPVTLNRYIGITRFFSPPACQSIAEISELTHGEPTGVEPSGEVRAIVRTVATISSPSSEFVSASPPPPPRTPMRKPLSVRQRAEDRLPRSLISGVDSRSCLYPSWFRMPSYFGSRTGVDASSALRLCLRRRPSSLPSRVGVDSCLHPLSLPSHQAFQSTLTSRCGLFLSPSPTIAQPVVARGCIPVMTSPLLCCPCCCRPAFRLAKGQKCAVPIYCCRKRCSSTA